MCLFKFFSKAFLLPSMKQQLKPRSNRLCLWNQAKHIESTLISHRPTELCVPESSLQGNVNLIIFRSIDSKLYWIRCGLLMHKWMDEKEKISNKKDLRFFTHLKELTPFRIANVSDLNEPNYFLLKCSKLKAIMWKCQNITCIYIHLFRLRV